MLGLKKIKIMKKIIRFLFLSCLKATELIEKKIHVRLNTQEQIRLTLHKSMCKACRLYEKQSRLIDHALKKHIPENINIEEFKLNIKNKLH
jgi:hypothetical protein